MDFNSVIAYDYSKLDLLRAFNDIHKFDIICLSETYLDSTFSLDHRELLIDNYTMVRSDHPADVRRGGVCIYYKKCLPIQILHISKPSECIVLELDCNGKKLLFSTLYRSPSQSLDEFENFLTDFEDCLSSMCSKNPDLITILGDFNAKSSNWWTGDNTSYEGLRIDSLTSFYGLEQLISEPTHIVNNSSSCIDLIFTSQPNIITHSGVSSSLHNNCHHQLTFAKFNLEIEYPPPYERVVWDYNKANTELIQRAIDLVNWENIFANLDIESKIISFNDIIMNVFSNFCPSKTITCNDKDPPWLNEEIKSLIKLKNEAYKDYQNSNKSHFELNRWKTITIQLNESINIAKQKYYSDLSSKLNDNSINRKKYWSILKSLWNGKKVPLIPPLLCNNNFITDFKDKAEIFNNYFADQCTPFENNSQIPNEMSYVTDKRIANIDFTFNDIFNLIKSLDIGKAHGYDNISVRMIKICGEPICRPLELIFRDCIRLGTFPEVWKKSNVVPVHKKNEKNAVKNYRPISLLPVCSKIMERLIFNSLHSFLHSNSLLLVNQSGFRSNDSCTNQLIAITHEIASSLDDKKSLEIRGVFLDMSKAFDKVWHQGLIYKLHTFGISSNLASLLTSFLTNRKQRVVLNGQVSKWKTIEAGVPQGSILGPLLFLIYVNDLSDNLKSQVKLFADDVSLFSVVHDPILSANDLNHDLKMIKEWSFNWKMSFNPDPLKQAIEVLFSKKRNIVHHSDIYFNGNVVTRSNSQKHLGMILDDKIDFNEHISLKLSKARKGVGLLRTLAKYIPRHSLLTIYKCFIRPHLDYGDVVYDKPNNESFTKSIESIQYNAALAITGTIRGTSTEKLYQELGLEYLSSRRWFRRLSTFYKIFKTKSPFYLYSLIPKINVNRSSRTKDNIPLLRTRTETFKNSFFPNAIEQWNKLDINIRESYSLPSFKKSLLKFIRPTPSSIYNINNPNGLKFLTRLRLSFSHLREHKFKHNFQDTIDPFCNCGVEIETTKHFLLHCQNFDQQRLILLNTLSNIDTSIINLNDSDMTHLLLFGKPSFNTDINGQILSSTITYIMSTKRFDELLF